MSGNGYKYIGTFGSYEQCAESPNIDPITKAITFNGRGLQGQYCSINDTNTHVVFFKIYNSCMHMFHHYHHSCDYYYKPYSNIL
jgi:hypothetical protein